jgi:prepilin-type N-terminal cleavage/methylation domain-containing protein
MILVKRGYGFTLVELLIVIIIVSVLAAIAIPKFASSSQRAKEAALRDCLVTIRAAGDRCEQDTGAIVDISDLTSATPPADGKKRGTMGVIWADLTIDPATWHGPYLEKMPINPITGTNGYGAPGNVTATTDWAFDPAQNVNTNHYYFPSKAVALNGTKYESW